QRPRKRHERPQRILPRDMLVPIAVAAPGDHHPRGSRLFEEKSHKSFKCKTASKTLSGPFRSVEGTMTSLDLPERPRMPALTLRRRGDVLLTTPLLRTMRRGFPRARLDMLVFRDTEDILRGNPDIDHVVSMPTRPSAGETLALVRSLW